MTDIGKENARRVRAGAVRSADGPEAQHTRTTEKIQYQPCADECCYRLGRALRAGRLEHDSWGFDFTRSVLKHNKRPAWVPSPKQLSAMRALVAELVAPDEDLIDGGDHD